MGCILLAGCGWWSSTSELDARIFDGYSIQIDSTYTEVSPALVENKQLLNKVVKSFKLPSEEANAFEPNIIISRSDLPPSLDFDQFWTLNAQKLGTMLAGYTPGEKELLSFDCNGSVVQWIWVTFSVQDPWYKTAPQVWLAQYQFVDKQKWYIISAAFLTQKEQAAFRDVIETIKCVEAVIGTGQNN